MRELARLYPQTNATTRGELLSFWDASRGPQRMFIRGLAIMQGLMILLLLAVCGKHRKSYASARQRASSRDRRAPGARRGTAAHRRFAAHGNPGAGLGRRETRRGDRRVVHRGVARDSYLRSAASHLLAAGAPRRSRGSGGGVTSKPSPASDREDYCADTLLRTHSLIVCKYPGANWPRPSGPEDSSRMV
jgi:hypothetical protein